MVKKSKNEINIDVETLRQHIEENIPSFISPNGGSLEEIQTELVKIYMLIKNILESLKDSVWDKLE